MNPITFSTIDYSTATQAAQTGFSAVAGTVTSNANYWFLLAAGLIVIGIIYILFRCLVSFGRFHHHYYQGKALDKMDDVSLASFDSIGEQKYASTHSYDGSKIT